MTPSPEALTWQRRADAWAQQGGEVEPYSGGGGQEVEPANRWSDVASTGRPTFPADGTGWRTQTSEWRATGARWRQTTEWRSSTGSHVWRSTTEAWQSENEGDATPNRPTISGTAWPTPEQESAAAARESWSETPSWRRAADTGRAATTPVEQTWSSSSGTPSWQQPSAQTPSWQQPAPTPSWQQPSSQTPSWQQPASTPAWQQPSSQTPSWQRPATDSWSSAASTSGSWSAERRGAPGENTTDIGGWEQRSDGPGWQAGPRDDGRHFVREDDRAAWQRGAETEWSTRRGRRRAPEPDTQPSGGSGWSTTSDTDNWAGHTDTGSIGLSPTSSMPDAGPPAPSWGGRSARRGYPAEPEGLPDAYGERSGQTPIRYGVRPESSTRLSRRAAPDDAAVPLRDEGAAASGGLPERQRGASQFRDEPAPGPAGLPERQRGAGQFGAESASGGLPEQRQRGAGRRGQRPQRYNANATNWREDTSSWDAEPDTSNWTRDPDTGQWSRAEDDPRVLAWRAEAARREQLKQDEEPQPEQPGPTGWSGSGRRGRRADEPTGPIGGVPGGPLPSSGMPDGPRPRSAMPGSAAPRSAMPGGTWSTGGAMPGPATPRSAMPSPGGAPWNGADQPDPYSSGRFRTDASRSGAAEAYGNDVSGRRRAAEPEPDSWSARRAGGPADEYPTEGWRQGPLPPRQDPPRELPAGRSGGWAEPGYAAPPARELPAGRSSWPDPERGVPRQTGFGSLPPEDSGWSEQDRGPRRTGEPGYGGPRRTGEPGYGYGTPDDDARAWSEQRRPSGARELPAAPQRRDDGYGRDPRKPAYGGQRELPSGPSSWSDQAGTPDYDDETDRYGNPRRRDDRDDPPYGGGGGARGQADWRTPGPPGGPSWNGGSGPANGWTGAGPGNGGYRRGTPDPGYSSGGAPDGGGWRASADTDAPGGDWRAELNGGTPGSAAPVSGSAGYRAAATPGDWRQELNGGGAATPGAAPVSGYRAAATPPGDWRAGLTGGGSPAAPATAAVPPAPGADWRAELTGGTAAPTSGAAGYRAAATGDDWRADVSAAPTSGAAPAAGSTGYRTAAAAPAAGDWRRELTTEPADGEAQRFSTSDFPSFRPSGSAAVAGRENLALSATSVITAPPGAAPGEAEEDRSWPPRRAAGGALFENTGSYERRPVSSGVPSSRPNDLLNPDEDEEEESSSSPLAAVGYTVVWYGVPVVLFVLGMLLLNTGQRAHALQTLADAAPEFGISLALSIVVAFGLRFATTAWKSASVGLAAAVVGAGLATVLSSAITGNSLS
ncbi:hypothetical protein ACTOB_008734 [Actinoplanes oblitus]|uniref:Uncharacterized protein n=1 Tax=Actinoplanes oblitus TaxID=3040509 RepID=A0ABY8WL95_9ACTN|nr:hypothetical protein [Actinoplanes oblitus]WIM96525.1 hypothetical protein ACTOB_008734 [Actinoplanes oblitus]